MLPGQLLSDESTKSLCTSHQCPICGVEEHVTVERVVVGDVTITRCHCRACGQSWDPDQDVAAAG